MVSGYCCLLLVVAMMVVVGGCWLKIEVIFLAQHEDHQCVSSTSQRLQGSFDASYLIFFWTNPLKTNGKIMKNWALFPLPCEFAHLQTGSLSCTRDDMWLRCNLQLGLPIWKCPKEHETFTFMKKHHPQSCLSTGFSLIGTYLLVTWNSCHCCHESSAKASKLPCNLSAQSNGSFLKLHLKASFGNIFCWFTRALSPFQSQFCNRWKLIIITFRVSYFGTCFSGLFKCRWYVCTRCTVIPLWAGYGYNWYNPQSNINTNFCWREWCPTIWSV